MPGGPCPGGLLLVHGELGSRPGVATLGIARFARFARFARMRHLGPARILTPSSAPHTGTQQTALFTLDQFAVDDLSRIQLDTEGYELPMLQGAEQTLLARKPVVVVEDDRNSREDYLVGLGYAAVRRLGRDTVDASAADASPLRSSVGT